jgi:hypothetical protein
MHRRGHATPAQSTAAAWTTRSRDSSGTIQACATHSRHALHCETIQEFQNEKAEGAKGTKGVKGLCVLGRLCRQSRIVHFKGTARVLMNESFWASQESGKKAVVE